MDLNKYSAELYPWIYFGVVFLGLSIAGRLILFFGFKHLGRLAARSEGNWDENLIAAVRSPLRLMIWIGALAGGLQFAPEAVTLTPGHWNIFRLVLVFWFFWTLWRTASSLLRSNLTQAWSDEARSLVLLVVRVVIFIFATLGAAETLGLSLTPVLASLGVGSLAVALALQDTLANFFAGIYLLIDKPVRVGDFVKVDDSTEGVVDRIGWRSTLLRQLSNNTVVIPNNKLLTSQLINFNLVESECLLGLPIGVAYSANLEQVESVLLEVAKEVLKAEKIYSESVPPVVRFRSFGESSVDLSLVVQLKDIQQQAVVRHQLIKAVHAAFLQKGIDIPFPQRTLHFSKPFDLR